MTFVAEKQPMVEVHHRPNRLVRLAVFLCSEAAASTMTGDAVVDRWRMGSTVTGKFTYPNFP